MRGTQAKALRRRVYGEGGSSRVRAYFTPDGREYRPADYSHPVTDHKGRVLGVAKRLWRAGETVVADVQRQVYQRMKKGHAVGQLFSRWITAER